MDATQVTPIVLTFNEAPNIEGTLSQLRWADRIVVVDSYSTDNTVELASAFSNVEIFHRRFDSHTAQWNYAIEQARTEWVLTLDADYLCPDALHAEIGSLSAVNDVYYARFIYCVLGHSLNASLYPPRAVLFKRDSCRYKPDGHTQLLDVGNATVGYLKTPILHDDRKSLKRWCASQVNYADLEAEKLEKNKWNEIGWKDRLRKVIFIAPALTLVYCLLVKRLILQGRPGLYYSTQRVYAELTLSLTLLDRQLRKLVEK